MTLFERYMLRQLLGPLGFFTLVLTGIVWLTQSLRVIDIVVNNGQGARVFLEFSALLLPAVLSIVLQLGALAATVLTLNRMIGEGEIIAAFAGGASHLQLARPFAIFGLGLAGLLAIDTTYLMPTTARIMRDRIAEVRGDIAAGLIRDGRFLNPAPGLTVYIREITPQNELKGVLVHDARNKDQPVTYTARSGFLEQDTRTPALILGQGRAQSLRESTNQLSLLRFDSFAYDLSSFVKKNENRFRKPSERYFWELIDPDPALANTRKARGKMVSEGHEQLGAPLYGFALPLTAASVLLAAAYSRRGRAGAIALAIVVGAGIRVFGLAMKSLVSGAPDLWPAMYAPPVFAIFISIWLLSRNRGRGAPQSGWGRRGRRRSAAA